MSNQPTTTKRAKAKAKTSEKRITEAIGFAGEIDEEAGIIRNALLGGYGSKNGYQYTDAAYDDAAQSGVYDGVDVYIDHSEFDQTGLSNPEPSVKEAWGCVENPRHVPGEGMRGDIHYLKSDPLTPKVLERIRRWPKRCGFSHDANCRFEDTAEGVQVTQVRKVFRVDLVRQPATTRGVWESVREQPMARNKSGRTREMEDGALDLVDDALAPLDDAATGEEAAGAPSIEDAVAALEAALSQAVAAIVADTTIDAAEMKERIGMVVEQLRGLMDTLTGGSSEAPASEEVPAQESARLREQVQRLESDIATLKGRVKKLSTGSLAGVLYRGTQESNRSSEPARAMANSRRVYTMHDED